MTFAATASISASGATEDRVVALEDTAWAWVAATCGLPADHVIWGDRGPVPSSSAYIALRFLDMDTFGGSVAWSRLESVGGQIIRHWRTDEQVTLEITCFAGTPTGGDRPEAILRRVLRSRQWLSAQSILTLGGVSIGPIDKVRVFPGMRGVMFDPRAVVRVTLYLRTDTPEVISAIEHVQATSPGPVTQVVDRQ
jgi:hypothetical protein